VGHMSKVERIPTGISGLDEMLAGGIPKGRVVLVVGGPGTGKTILSAQYLVNGIVNHGEPGLFITLDENRNHLIREMASFGWDIPGFEKANKWAFTDVSPSQNVEGEAKSSKLTIGKKDFSMEWVIAKIKAEAKSLGARRLVVDPITSLVFHYQDTTQRRSVILDLVDTLSSTDATTIMTTELRIGGLERNVQLEEYLAHGVIVLQTLQVGKAVTRVIQIEKMRETPIDTQIRPYRITEKGIEIYSRESVF
jgi:KaiC/GvpD/RAD55 family RecA-like ATPase